MQLIIVDSGDGSCSAEYMAMLPEGITVRGHSLIKEEKQHPHGYQCGYYATHLLHGRRNLELVFVRIFDGEARPIHNSNEWLLEVLQEECKPDASGSWPVINMSWGADDQDNSLIDRQLGAYWGRWGMKFASVIGSSSVFCAAGNDDHNDADDDLSYPWRLVPHTCIVTGSHRRDGVPSVFSGDGKGVFLTMWGERLPLLDQLGFWSVGSGTSFASPKAAGLCAYLKLGLLEFKDYVKSHATKPDQYSGYLPHNKWGYGSLEYRYQEASSTMPEERRPPPLLKPHQSVLQYHDYKML